MLKLLREYRLIHCVRNFSVGHDCRRQAGRVGQKPLGHQALESFRRIHQDGQKLTHEVPLAPILSVPWQHVHMTIQTARYIFTRDEILGFLNRNRASTDALNALEQWQHASADRSYEVLVDEPDSLEVRLSLLESDSNAGPELHGLCHKHGVKFEFMPA